MQSKNRRNGQQNRANKDNSSRNNNNNNGGKVQQNQSSSRKGQSLNKKNTNNKKNSNNKMTKTVAAPDMSASNFPSLVSTPASPTGGETTSNTTSPETSPVVTKVGGWSAILKKATKTYLKPKKKSVSPKTTATTTTTTASNSKVIEKKSKKKSNKSSDKNKSPKVVESTQEKVSKSSISRPRRGWEKTEELKQAKEAAQRLAREEELKRKTVEKTSTKKMSNGDQKVKEDVVDVKSTVADKKEGESNSTQKNTKTSESSSSSSSSGWGAKKSFAAILKEKRDARMEEPTSPSSNAKVCQ